MFLVIFHQPPQLLPFFVGRIYFLLLNGHSLICSCLHGSQVTFCQSRHEMGAEGDVKVNSFPGPTKIQPLTESVDGTVMIALGVVKPFPAQWPNEVVLLGHPRA